MNYIEEFWKVFISLFKKLEGGNPDAKAMDELLDALNEIDSRLYYHLGSKDDGTDLILSAEGNPDLMVVLEKIKLSEPTLPKWEVLAVYEGMLLFGERNEEVFPNNLNGDVLYRMARNGDQLWKERNVDFSYVFPNEKSATNFQDSMSLENISCEVSTYDGAEGYSHQVELALEMVPTYANISQAESSFGKIAENYGGRNDGWGCFEIKS